GLPADHLPAPAGHVRKTQRADMRTRAEANWQRWAILAFAIAVLVLSFAILRSAYYQLVLTQVLLWAVLSLAWNLLCGYSGYFSFGHAAFWGLGAYTVALGLLYLVLTPWISIPFCAVVGAVAGAIIGYPTFRLRGHYFALAMLAYPLATLYVFQWLGYQELALPMKREAPLLYMQFEDQRLYVVLALGLLVGALLISLKVENSRFGMALLAIKQNEPAAEAAGINTWRWKMLPLMLSGAIAAIAGGLYGVVLLVVNPETVFGMPVSAQALILALFGGVGSLWGPVIGVMLLVPLAEGLHAELGDVRPNQVCRRGIGRTFQVVRAFPRMTVLENVIVGAFVGAPDDATARQMALAALDRVGLSAQSGAIAGGLTTRELRLMELARALVPHPRLMLLDETLAGLGHGDLDGILGVIRQLRADGITVLIIEHTMHAMVQLVEHVTVLDHGRMIASGRPNDV